MLKIYNTKSKKIEVFEPVNPERVSMYVCGPTVYSDIHIGNARPVIFFDVLRNYLAYKKYNVNYVSNITDIDDKIIDESKRLNIKESELTSIYTKAFIEANKTVGSQLPNFMPHATNYVPEMIRYIDKLINKGYAYQTDSGVYFHTTKLEDYGSLSGQKLDDLEESVRIINNPDKKDFRDFTLWKTTTEGLSFESPFGKGRPGWHTECAVMNHELFGGTIDIHGGGSDLIFPHHENENAQTIAHSDHELAKYWMHVGRVDFGNEKMSKSLGNTILVKELTKPMSYRLLILAHHYRNPINFNEDIKNEFEEMYDKIVRTIRKVLLEIGTERKIHSKLNNELINEFEEAMDNDLNTPNVITLILHILKELNKAKDLYNDDAIMLFNTLNKILAVLGIDVDSKLTVEIEQLHQSWIEARNEKDYNKADELRNELAKIGWI